MEELIKQVHTFYHDFPIVLGMTVVFSVAERFFPAGAQKSFKGWVFNFIHIGLPVSLGGNGLVQKMLYGLSGMDPASVTLAVALLLVAGMIAGYLPARRASRINPMVALRDE